ncbi:MAG: glycosyltransferase family 2 protein [Gemmatimonadota bacterium]
MTQTKVSIVIPCRNEARYIEACLESILAADYPADLIEVLVVDGGSDDGSRDIVARYAATRPRIRLLENALRITPAAMNIGIRAASGDVIMRMDAHVVYPGNYIRRLITALESSGADNVGGVIETLPGDGTAVARAIAVALSHPFGVGDSYFRIGTRAPRLVDSVAFGCWRRELFGRVGLFDEELVRNQDDEFNYRIAQHGGRVLLVPDIVARYYARRSLRKIGRTFYQYGYFKPLVAKKLGRVATVRQMIPALLVVVVLGSAMFQLGRRIFGLPVFRPLIAAALVLYLIAVVACSLAAVRRHGWRCALALAATFPTLHWSYGVGYLRGVWDHIVRGRRRQPRAVPLTR